MSDATRRGPIAWMANNGVTPNLLMIVLLAGGLFMSTRIKQEVFPEFDLDIVTVTVAYPGASPEEVEQGIVLAVEEVVRGLEGVEEVKATANEGVGVVTVEILDGSDPQLVFQDVQQEVERIRTLPVDAEEPEITLNTMKHGVVDVQIYGEASEWALRDLAEQVRDRLLADPGITQIELKGARDYEVHVEVSQATLRRYGLALQDVSRAIAATSVEIPAGSIDTKGGEILLRLRERADWAEEFAEIPIVTTAGGALVRLADIATVSEGFEDVDRFGTYDGSRAIGLSVFRVGDQTPIGVSDAVRAALDDIRADLPPGVDLAVNRDMSEIYRARLSLLLRNGFLGLCLVLIVLGLFLDFRLAFWVTMGIPVSFLGGLLFLPGIDVTINMVSMFAFIVSLGIVVDDAIVAGENIHEYRQRGMNYLQAAIRGAQDVALPITFSILTNIAAFFPLMLVPGMMGKFFRAIPIVVATVFVISWVESLLILPAHLSHERAPSRNPFAVAGRGVQSLFSRGLAAFIHRAYTPFLTLTMRFRYITLAAAFGVLILTAAFAKSGRMGFVLMPKAEADSSVVTAVLPYGSPLSAVFTVRDRLVAAAGRVGGENGGDALVEGVFAVITENRVEVSTYLTDAKVRPITTGVFTDLWRETAGEIPGLESILYEADRGGPGRGRSVSVELSHRDIAVLDAASSELAAALEGFGNVKDIDDGYSPGKPQLDLRLKAEGRALGLTSSEVARQVRNAFYGAEVLRQQRGRNEMKVIARLPEAERSSEHAVETLMIRTPSGTFVPLREIAEVERGRSYTSIGRRDARRTVTVTANVTPDRETNLVIATLKADVLPRLARDHRGLSFSFEGRQADMRESMQGLITGLLGALIAIYALLAVPFRSYVQPLIVMAAIPFGIVGAVFGHLLMGFSMSILSLMGIVALSGVVVNDALVMIDYGNRRRIDGLPAFDAIFAAGIRRFRPILLTTLTTFGGLAPMVFETSRQARFLIPMALSLAYGLVFATVITLILVPCLYMVLEDALGLFRRLFGGGRDDAETIPMATMTE
ncbi:MAG: efflux RND transporter permease subunit [Planctomycetota bacterium]